MMFKKIFTLLLLLSLSLNIFAQDNDTTDIYTFVETKPVFPGGEQALMEYLGKNIVYPPLAIKNGTEGKVYISFIVNKDGSIGGTKVMRGIGSGCDEEAMRVVNSMPRWMPGKSGNKPVRVQFMLPIKFELTQDEDNLYTSVAVTEKPTFIGGETALEKYLSENLRYPGVAKKAKVAGDVKVNFIIEKDGSLSGIKILKGLGSGCDEEALRLVKEMPKWNPAKEADKAVRCLHDITISFGVKKKK